MKRKFLKKERGTAIVEFALVLPLLIVLLFGIIEFSLALYDKAVVTNASREGARRGIVAQAPRVTISEIETIVNHYCQDYLITFGVINNPVTTVDYSSGQNFSDPLTVTVTYNYGFLVLPNFITTLINPFSLSARTVMKYE